MTEDKLKERISLMKQDVSDLENDNEVLTEMLEYIQANIDSVTVDNVNDFNDMVDKYMSKFRLLEIF